MSYVTRLFALLSILLLCGIVLTPASAQAQDVIYVDSTATGAGDGSSWEDAYTDLQDAMDEAEGQTGIEIWVAEGTYIPSEQTSTDDERTATFNLLNGVSILGGFNGDESQKENRDADPSSNNTVLSGDIGARGFEGDNSYHVVNGEGLDNTSLLDGFTITKGRADGDSRPHWWGAGIRLKSASTELSNLIIKNNFADTGGGGAMLNTSSSEVSDVTFINNEGRDGGGLEADGNFELENVTFSGNIGTNGGGAAINGGSPTLLNVTFEDNEASDSGGGIRASVGIENRLKIKNSSFNNNSTSGFGGGVASNYGGITMENVEFVENSADSGGGMWVECGGTNCFIINTQFENNSADFGGGIEIRNGDTFLVNSTLIGNSSKHEGDAISFEDTEAVVANSRILGHLSSSTSSTFIAFGDRSTIVNSTISNNSGDTFLNKNDGYPKIENSVLWGNEGEDIVVSSGQVLVSNSVVEDGIPDGAVDNGGNVAQDPLFSDPDGPDGVLGTSDDDLRLKGPPNPSPAIDAGDNELIPQDVADLDGDGDTHETLPLDFAGIDRTQNVLEGSGKVVDIGAYESDGSPLPVELASFNGTTTDQNVQLTWQTASETDNAGFEVQRKEESAWSQIGYVESKAQGGTTTEAKSYRFRAKDLAVGTHQFRLKQVDLDGSSSIHGPISVDVKMQEAVKLVAPAPNPISSTATLSFAVKEKSRARVYLYNTLGQKVTTLYEGTTPAGERQTTQIDAKSLPSGTYFIRLQAGQQTTTKQFTVVR